MALAIRSGASAANRRHPAAFPATFVFSQDRRIARGVGATKMAVAPFHVGAQFVDAQLARSVPSSWMAA
jgi:hypothetical protein